MCKVNRTHQMGPAKWSVPFPAENLVAIRSTDYRGKGQKEKEVKMEEEEEKAVDLLLRHAII